MHKLSVSQIETVVSKSSTALFQYCKDNKKTFLITGVSGGLDSAVTIALAEKACIIAAEQRYPLYSAGLILPCRSDPEHEILARQAIQKFNAEEILIPLDHAYTFVGTEVLSTVESQISDLRNRKKISPATSWDRKVARGNLKVRLRMMCGTYHVARLLDGIVLSTDNYSEYLMGFWTLNGDVGDYGPIQQIFKGVELYDIAEYLGVPKGILQAKPTDGLGLSNGDEEQLGADYRTVDYVMIELIKNGFEPDGSLQQLDNLASVKNIPPDLVKQLAKRCLSSSYKRKGTVALSRQELGLPEIC